MGVVEQTSGAVESQLSSLEERYGSFSVNQHTVTVPQAQYEDRRGKDGCEQIDLYVKGRNDHSDVLHVEREGATALPSAETTVDAELERVARQTVEAEAGISCQVEGVDAVTILGLQDATETERETVYTLAVMVAAEHTEGTADEAAVWDSFDPGDHPAYA
jgi:ADP-ribose pyrophosphatase YjhB (NUDIX family)